MWHISCCDPWYRSRSCCSLEEKSFGLGQVSAGNVAHSLPVYVQDVVCMLSHHLRQNRDIHGTTPHEERKHRGLHFSLCVKYSLVFACLELIMEHYPIVFPTHPVGFKELAAGFRQWQHDYMCVFLHVLGTLDGILLKIRQPSVSEIPQPTLYHCRKGFHALNVQDVCCKLPVWWPRRDTT